MGWFHLTSRRWMRVLRSPLPPSSCTIVRRCTRTSLVGLKHSIFYDMVFLFSLCTRRPPTPICFSLPPGTLPGSNWSQRLSTVRQGVSWRCSMARQPPVCPLLFIVAAEDYPDHEFADREKGAGAVTIFQQIDGAQYNHSQCSIHSVKRLIS